MTVVTAPTVTSKVAIPNALAEYRAPLNSSSAGGDPPAKVTVFEFFKDSISWAETPEEGPASGPPPRLDVVLLGGGGAEAKLVLEFTFGLEATPDATPGLTKAVRLGGGGVPCSNVSVTRVARCRRRRTIGKASAAVVTASYLGRGSSTVIIKMCNSEDVFGQRTRATGTHLGIAFFSSALL